MATRKVASEVIFVCSTGGRNTSGATVAIQLLYPGGLCVLGNIECHHTSIEAKIETFRLGSKGWTVRRQAVLESEAGG